MNSQIIAVPASEELKNRHEVQSGSGGVFIPLEISGFLENPNDARVFSQIVNWSASSKKGGTKLRIHREGYYWLAKKHKDWLHEIGVKERTARESIARLQKQGLIEVKFWRFGRDNMNHYRINVEKVAEVMPGVIGLLAPEVTNTGRSRCHETASRNDTKGQFDLTSNGRSITKNTTKTTANKNNSIGRNPKDVQESSLSDDICIAFQEFCAEFSCTPSVLIRELRKLSLKDQAGVIKAARQRIHENKKPILNLGGFAFTTVQKLVSSFLAGDQDCFDVKNVNQEVNSLIEELGWSNAQRVAILLERHQVHAFSDLSPNQKQDFCNYLRSMASSSSN